jgi:hypothetical protein
MAKKHKKKDGKKKKNRPCYAQLPRLRSKSRKRGHWIDAQVPHPPE